MVRKKASHSAFFLLVVTHPPQIPRNSGLATWEYSSFYYVYKEVVYHTKVSFSQQRPQPAASVLRQIVLNDLLSLAMALLIRKTRSSPSQHRVDCIMTTRTFLATREWRQIHFLLYLRMQSHVGDGVIFLEVYPHLQPVVAVNLNVYRSVYTSCAVIALHTLM
jgi:hypothetical protein